MVRHIEQHQWAVIVSVLCLTLAGCSGTPQNVVLDTPSGPVALNAPPPPSGGLAAPPPNLMPAQPPVAAGSINLNGTYSGSMNVLVTNGNQCQSSTPVRDFTVADHRVRFGGFRGTIQANGGLQMTYGGIWIIGQFNGPSFHGQVNFPGRFDSPGCTYLMDLQRTG
jgi:hypothetical protein